MGGPPLGDRTPLAGQLEVPLGTRAGRPCLYHAVGQSRRDTACRSVWNRNRNTQRPSSSTWEGVQIGVQRRVTRGDIKKGLQRRGYKGGLQRMCEKGGLQRGLQRRGLQMGGGGYKEGLQKRG